MAVTHYSFLNNWRFYWRIARQSSPTLLPTLIGYAVLETFLNLGTIILPTLVVQLLTQQAGLPYLAAVVISFGVALAAITVGHGFLDIVGTDHSTIPRLEMANQLNAKIMAIDYQMTEDPKIQQLFSTAFNNGLSYTLAGGQAFFFGVERLLRDILSLIALTITISFFTPLIFALILFSGVISYLMLQWYRRWYTLNHHTKDETKRRQEYLRENAYATENGKDVRLYEMATWYHQHFEQLNHDLDQWQQKESTRQFISDLVSDGATIIRDGFAYLYLALQIMAKSITATQLTLFFTTMTQFSQLIDGTIQDLHMLQTASVDLQELRQFLDLPEAPKVSTLTTTQQDQLHQSKTQIQFDHVSFTYPGAAQPTIRDLSFAIAPDEKIALVGANGAGKTTITRLMIGLLKPTSGRILINGIPTSELIPTEQYERFSPVFQDSTIMALTLKENICLSTHPDDARVWRVLEQVGLADLVKKLPQQLETPMTRYVDQNGVEFSGGQIQKLMLARALYKDAPFLVLDEPTAALDPIAESDMYQQYAAMTIGKTSLFISHRLASTRFCDRILYVDQGELKESGTHDELMSQHGDYAHIYDIQSHYYQTKASPKEVAE